MERKRKTLLEEPSLEAQERLIEIMNDSPRIESFAGTQWEIRALKPGTQWMVAQEAVAINKAETSNYGDVIKQFAINTPSVCKVMTLCLLNDRNRIFANGRDGELSKEYYQVYDTLMWETDHSKWLGLFVKMMELLDVELFFSTTSSITILRQRLLERKKTMEERKLLLQGQNGAK